jgi:hypothetical protein
MPGRRRYRSGMIEPGRRARVAILVAVAAGTVALAGLVGFGLALRRPALSVPPMSSVSSVVHPLPNVLLAVRDLSRLESVSFHMERVIDLTEKQSRLFGLIEGEDAILLVAVADVTAGVDLAKLGAGDVEVDEKLHRAVVKLPPAEIFHAALDNQRTYVHTRRTGLLAHRQEALEARARSAAEQALLDAAREAGILKRAEESARRAVERLLRSLGYDTVEVRSTAPPAVPLAPPR